MMDKTEDHRFFVLTLFAAAREILKSGQYTPDEILDICLLVGLPPAHLGAQKTRFEQYFLTLGNLVDFRYQDKPFMISFSKVFCYPQAHAAVMPIFQQVRTFSQTVIVDIGGFTTDYLQLKKGRADLSVCDSLEYGVIRMYNQIISKGNAEYNTLLSESTIDDILTGEGGVPVKQELLDLVEEQAGIFVDNLFGMLRERLIDLNAVRVIFVGGGAMLLKDRLKKSGKADSAQFLEDVSANAKGYELLYRALRSVGKA